MKVTHSMEERQFTTENRPHGQGARNETDRPHSLPLTRTLLNALQRQQFQTPGTNFSVSLSGEDDTELRDWWEKLSADGTVSVPLDKQMWGDVFGMCTDRFGTPWMVNISEPQG